MMLDWLPAAPGDWRARVRGGPEWAEAVALAGFRLGFSQTGALDGAMPEAPKDAPAVRLAVLGSATMAHVLPAIRVAGLRRGMAVATYEADFGQYLQTLTDGAALRDFAPTAILLALDAHHLAAGVTAGMDAAAFEAAVEDAMARVRHAWALARGFGCPVLHQTALPVHPGVAGGNEHRAGSRAAFVARLNAEVRAAADSAGVHVLALDDRAAADGVAAWHDATLWHHAKQEISPGAAPMYGELVARLLAALRGLSAKCLVLDLDNTLWGGVIGDDGMDGIVLGQGSAAGEAFAAFQDYARELSRRGVILAVCSKNDAANAWEPFDSHPEMVLRRGDISAFVANWSDKAGNIRAIAETLNIGLDSLVFVDDNPFERELVRRELPMVRVPELGEDAAGYARTIADAGYFEAVAVTEEDRARTGQYIGNQARDALRESATDLEGYLRGLEMQLVWRRFDRVGLQRTVQLINKTNQFNLTTRRYAEADVLAVMDDKRAFGLQLRLLDRFGDNGVIAIVIGRLDDAGVCEIDTWLMSCRVLGRQVEATTLNLVAEMARALGARRLVGVYAPTKKNGMVRDHYERLGFSVTERGEDGGSRAVLELAGWAAAPTFIHVVEG